MLAKQRESNQVAMEGCGIDCDVARIEISTEGEVCTGEVLVKSAVALPNCGGWERSVAWAAGAWAF